MSDSPASSIPEHQLSCQFCGAPAPQWVSTCVQCGRQVNPAAPTSRRSSQVSEIVIAVVLFAAINFVLLTTMDSRRPVSPQRLALQLFWDDRLWPHFVRACFFGPPFLFVVWKWYKLMGETDPDYGQLWRVYFIAQGLTLIAAIALCLAAGLITILAMIFLLITAAGQ